MPKFKRSYRRGRRFRKYPRTIGRVRRVSRRTVSLIKAAELRNSETKYHDIGGGVQAVSLRVGDGTTPELRVFNPASLIAQGVQKDEFIGNRIWIKGVRLRFSVETAAANDFGMPLIRFIWFFSRSNASLGTSGSLFNSTTTVATNPAQTAPAQNPVIFDTTASFWTGTSPATPFDTTNIKILKVKTMQLNPGGGARATQLYKLWFPLLKNHTYLDPQESSLATPPNHGKYGSYYLAWQVFQSGTAAEAISNTVIAEATYHMRIYFKDI